MVVGILDSSNQEIQPSTAYLKLFASDRQFTDQLQRGNGIDPLERDMEESYNEFV